MAIQKTQLDSYTLLLIITKDLKGIHQELSVLDTDLAEGEQEHATHFAIDGCLSNSKNADHSNTLIYY